MNEDYFSSVEGKKALQETISKTTSRINNLIVSHLLDETNTLPDTVDNSGVFHHHPLKDKVAMDGIDVVMDRETFLLLEHSQSVPEDLSVGKVLRTQVDTQTESYWLMCWQGHVPLNQQMRKIIIL
jgi:hypothetical protein